MTQTPKKQGDRLENGRFAKGNTLRLQHGCRARLPLGNLAPQLRTVQRHRDDFRRRLQDAVEARFGRISTLRMSAIFSAAIHYQTARLILRRLEKHGLDLDHATFISMTEILSREVDRLTSAVESLGLDEETKQGVLDGLASLYSGESEALGSMGIESALDARDAAEAKSGAEQAG